MGRAHRGAAEPEEDMWAEEHITELGSSLSGKGEQPER